MGLVEPLKAEYWLLSGQKKIANDLQRGAARGGKREGQESSTIFSKST